MAVRTAVRMLLDETEEIWMFIFVMPAAFPDADLRRDFDRIASTFRRTDQ
jgi:hypothetical protein